MRAETGSKVSTHRSVFAGGRVLVLALLLLVADAGSAYAAPPISYQEVVVRKLVNSSGGEVLYRQGYYQGGSRGFGRDKVHNKHGITKDNIVAAVVRHPQEAFQDDVANLTGPRGRTGR